MDNLRRSRTPRQRAIGEKTKSPNMFLYHLSVSGMGHVCTCKVYVGWEGGRQGTTQGDRQELTEDQAGGHITTMYHHNSSKVRQDREDFSTLGLGRSGSGQGWVTPLLQCRGYRDGNPELATMYSSTVRLAALSPNHITPLPIQQLSEQRICMMASRSRQNWISLVRRLLGAHILFLHGLAEIQKWRRRCRRPRIRDQAPIYQLQPGHIAWLAQSDAESGDSDDDGWLIARHLGDNP